MPGGLWVPGAVWEFRQNVRTLSTTGVQVVQSSTEPTTWQWEYTIQPEDEPILDTVGRGDVPPDMLYGCLVNFWFLNNSGAAQTYNCRMVVQSQTLGTFQSNVITHANVPDNNYVYFTLTVHSVGVGTTLRAWLWGTAAHDLAGIRLILVPVVTPPQSDVLLLLECLSANSTPGVGSTLPVAASVNWALSSFTNTISGNVGLTSVGSVTSAILLPLASFWRGGAISWLMANNYGNLRSIGGGGTRMITLYSNGYYGAYDVTLLLRDVRFGHLFRNLAGVSKL
jgi:hypothetical protein